MATIPSSIPSSKPVPTLLPIEVSKEDTSWYEEASIALRDAFSQGDNSMFAFYSMQDISMSSLDY